MKKARRVIRYRCPKCGGALTLHIRPIVVVCARCGRVMVPVKGRGHEEAREPEPATAR